MAFVIDRSLYLSPEVVGEPGLRPLKEVDPFSLEALVAWLEKQPGETEYDYFSYRECLLARYAEFAGIEYVIHMPFTEGTPSVGTLMERVAVMYPRTYSAALSRARKLLAERGK